MLYNDTSEGESTADFYDSEEFDDSEEYKNEDYLYEDEE